MPSQRQQKNPTLIKIAIDGLSDSVKGFEILHPQLVEAVHYSGCVNKHRYLK